MRTFGMQIRSSRSLCGHRGAPWVFALWTAAVGCSSEAVKERDAEPPADAGMPSPSPPLVVSKSLVPLAGNDLVFRVPHTVRLIKALDGSDFEPPLVTTTDPEHSSRFVFEDVPSDVNFMIHVIGRDEGEELSTVDTILVHAAEADNAAVFVPLVVSWSAFPRVAMFEPHPDRAAVRGVLFFGPSGAPQGTVRCAQVFLDDEGHPSSAMDQRYPEYVQAGLIERMATPPNGRFFFGNVPTGKHTLRVTVDGGRNFLAEKSFFIPMARSDARGPTPEIVYDVPFLVATSDPTPADCEYGD